MHNHMSLIVGYIADVAWCGLLTVHGRCSLAAARLLLHQIDSRFCPTVDLIYVAVDGVAIPPAFKLLAGKPIYVDVYSAKHKASDVLTYSITSAMAGFAAAVDYRATALQSTSTLTFMVNNSDYAQTAKSLFIFNILYSFMIMR
jgi:hypothetical protein